MKRDNKPPSNVPPGPSAASQDSGFWRPDWRWHAKALTAIYLVLLAAYFAVNAFLSRVPEPYRLRDVPRDVTPWLNK